MTAPLTTMCVTCPFGWRIHPVTKERQFHSGVDLKAALGTPVRAPFDGVVALTSRAAGGHQLILTNHNAHLRAGFAHLSDYAKGIAPGSQVKEGEVIAYTGESGRVTGPHLHYTLSVIKGSGKTFFDPEIVIYSHS